MVLKSRSVRSYLAFTLRRSLSGLLKGNGVRSFLPLGLMCLLALYGSGQAAVAQIQLVPVIRTVAGNGTQGFSGNNGPATSAELMNPPAVAVDIAGNLYIVDSGDEVIRKVSAGTGLITTVVGNGGQGYSGDNGPATSAELNYPTGVAVDGAGNLYIADTRNNVIRKVAAGTGLITTVAGNGTQGYSGDGGAAPSAQLNSPDAVAVDSVGNLYIADTANSRIREVSAGTITTVAGNGTQGYSGDGALATSAELNSPSGVAVDGAGHLYIADSLNNRIREVSAGTITTVAGNGTPGYNGDGVLATSAQLSTPSGVAVDGAGNLYIADQGNDRVREVSVGTGLITTVAGNYGQGYSGDGGAAISAELFLPSGVAVDGAGNLYIADTRNYAIREVSTNPAFPATAIGSTSAAQNVLLQLNSAQTITSITAAQSQGGKQEYTVGTITGCSLGTTSNASGTVCTVPLTFQPAYAGNRGVSLQVVSSAGTSAFGLNGVGTAPQVALTPGTMMTVAGNGTWGYSGDNGAATGAELGTPAGVAVDSAGNLYIAASGTYVVRKIAAGTGVITTVAGTGVPGYSGDGGAATQAELGAPYAVAVDGAGNLYIADFLYNVIREVSAGTGIITTVAGNGHYGFSGDGGLATSAELYAPYGVAVDSAGNLYIVDTTNDRIRKVSAATGIITTVAGNGTSGYSGDGGLATSAELNDPQAVAVDGAGNLYIADVGNDVIRKVSAGTGVITTVAGNGTEGYSGDGGAASSAELYSPLAVAVDPAGDLYISDAINQRIREVSAGTGIITTVAGNGHYGYSGDGGAATSAELHQASGLALDSTGNLYIGDTVNNVIREVEVTIPPALTFPTATPVGSTDSMDGPQTIAISNIGNAALTLPTPTTGMNPSVAVGFTLDSASTCPSTASSAGMLASGTECTFAVDFAPTAVGAINGSLVLTDNTLNAVAPSYATQSIALSGTALQGTPTITWATPAAISYGTALSATQLNASSPVAGTFTYSQAAGTVLTAGPHTITVTFTPTDTTDYTTTTATVTLTVNQATPTITWATPAAVTAGTALSATQLNASSPVAGTFTYSPVSGTVMNGSQTLSVTFTPTDTTDYTTATATVTLTVNKTTPTIAWATPAAIPYGTALSATQLNASSTVAGSFTYSPVAGTVLNAGAQTLSVTFTPTNTTDYATATSTVTLTVTKAAPTITWATPAAIPYGTALSATQLNASSTVAGSFTYNPAAGTVLNAGPQTLSVTFTPTNTTDYATATSTVTLTVNKAASTITWATPAAIPYGTALSATQLNATSTVAGTYTYSPVAGTVLNAGPQTLTATFTPTNTTDYATATSTVTLTVNQAKPTITWATPAAITAGTALSGTQLNATASVAGSFTYNPAAGTVLSAGVQPLTVTFTPTNTTDYTTATATVSLTVSTPIVPVLTFAPILTQVEGAAPFAVSATSASSGAVTYAVTSGPATIASNMVTVTGLGTVVLTANQAASGSYTTATTTTSFTVVSAPFTLTTATGTTAGSSGTTASVAPGSAASFSFTLAPVGTTVPDPITFAATGLPTGATATFSPTTIAAGSAATPVTLTIQTANTQTARNEQPISGNPLAPVALSFLLLPLLGMKAARRRLRQMPRLPLVLLAVGLSLGAVLGISGCAGGSGTPPAATTPAAQTYTVVVTATDTTTKLQSAVNLTVTVQ